MEEYYKKIIEILSDNTLQVWGLVLSFLTTALWGIYVYFTIKTFREIKQQTMLQSRAFLLVKPYIDGSIFSFDMPQEALEIHEKWKTILRNNLPDAVKQEVMYSLKMINRGKSDITRWRIDVYVEIKSCSYLREKIGTNNEDFSYSIVSNLQQQISPDDPIEVPFFASGYFPEANVTWEIKYEDFRGNSDKLKDDIGLSVSNIFALDFGKQEH